MRSPFLLTAALLPLSLLAADPPKISYGFAEAQKTMSTMTAADGLQATLFASEPQIQNPTNIDIDPRGRVWAVEAVNYRTTMHPWMLRPEGDRVVVLADTNGDGIADQETTFWQSKELIAPLGICVLPQAKGTKVIVSAAPNVWLLTDTDGDDKADKVEKLFTVGGSWDHDHQVHAFSYGLDGRFYFNMGNAATKLMDPEGKTIVDVFGREVAAGGNPYRQGMIFRCDIDLEKGVASKVEPMAWNFRNNYKVAVDSFGALWQSDNDDDGNKGVRINYILQHGNYGYSDEMTGASWQTPRSNIESEIPKRHWHQNDPGSVPNLLQTGSGSPTGMVINEGALLGKRFENQMIHCDAGPRTVRAYPVTNDGAGYKAEIVDILTSSDNWYRPADVAIAPDGSLFVADWYDPGVGGHNMGDHEAGSVRGRLYRVAPADSKYAVKAPNFSTPEGCVEALKSPNRSTQYVAARTLEAMGDKAKAALATLAKDANSRFRARAMAIMGNIPSLSVEALRAGLADADSDVRVAAARLARTLDRYGLTDPSQMPGGILLGLLHDPSPQVRREIVLAMYGDKDVAEPWAALAKQYDGKDRWYLEALGIGATGNDDACFDAWLAAVGGETGPWNNAAGRDIIWRLRGTKTAHFLARILTEPGLPAEDAPKFLRAFDFLPAGDEKTKALVQLARLTDSKKAIAAEALQRLKGVDLAQNAELKAAVTDALKNTRGTAQFVELVRDFKLGDQRDGLYEIVLAHPDSPEGVDATKLLLDGKLPAKNLNQAETLNLIRALGNTADGRAVPLLKKAAFLPAAAESDNPLQAAGADPVLRQQAVRSLTKSSAGIEAILTAAGNGSFPEDCKPVATAALATVQLPKYKAAIAQYFPPPAGAAAQTLPPIADLVNLKGKVEHGKQIFAAPTSVCITCHKIGQVGVDFGPGLSEIGTKLGKAAIYESIIDPNAGVSMGFETTVLTMKDGSSAIGIIRSETAEEVVLAMPGGIVVKNKPSDIAKREKLPTSMMPAGLSATLSQQDLVDLVEYLASLKAPAK
ncbi:MAG TPA: PVC-type heme-binding CxxCH protein [Chthoniobacteraceae bacterium]|jgi:putative membrane-bound dehydrogenase-like protein|nr:PVC-type heme-binding CxxCH protein [Chthoniobacteraceae bacterium]